MVLTIEEKSLFWKNWQNLLASVNDKYKIDDRLAHPNNPAGINIEAVRYIFK
jgi:hypothetical protein